MNFVNFGLAIWKWWQKIRESIYQLPTLNLTYLLDWDTPSVVRNCKTSAKVFSSDIYSSILNTSLNCYQKHLLSLVSSLEKFWKIFVLAAFSCQSWNRSCNFFFEIAFFFIKEASMACKLRACLKWKISDMIKYCYKI